MKLQNLTGLKFGTLTILSMSKSGKFNKVHWFCKCDCGNARMCSGARLKNGALKYCSKRCPFKPKPRYVRPSRFKSKQEIKIVDPEKQNAFLAQFLGTAGIAKRGSNFRVPL